MLASATWFKALSRMPVLIASSRTNQIANLGAATAMGALSKKTGQANLKDADSPDSENLLVSFSDNSNYGNFSDELFNVAKRLVKLIPPF